MSLLDWLLPTECLGCRAEGTLLCSACLSGLPLAPLVPPVSSLADVRCATAYASPVRELIHRCKYDLIKAAAQPLAELILSCLRSQPLAVGANVALVPVPLHRRRLRERGFNQAELIARHIGSAAGWPVCPRALERTRATTPQFELSRAERATNLCDAFVAAEALPSGVTAILVDDVLTTGSTLAACAEALRVAEPSRRVLAACVCYDLPS